MPNIDIVKKLPISTSYNYKWVVDRYDLNPNVYQKEWKFSFEFPEIWSVGLIVGGSGSGKSLIANEIFDEVLQGDLIEMWDVPLVEAFKNKSMQDISNALVNVGLGSIPEWITSYHCLSTGQKMRANLAFCLLSEKKLIVYDEFTSVVDRQVAKVLSYSISRAFKKSEKQFVAISCHRDIVEWLEPDWVIDMDAKNFEVVKKKDQISTLKSNLAIKVYGNFSKTIII